MTQITIFDQFSTEIARREDEIAAVLPPHIPFEKFRQTALIAVKNNPALLRADRRSLHQAITEAAEDGLHPDGREGVISIYKEKQKDGSYLEVANWNPMIWGIRKRALELCQIVIDANVVHERDHWRRRQGDDPCIEHEPPPLGEDRGKPVGAYAIFRRGSEILHREVMDVKEIEVVKAQSRQQGGLLWTKFWGEAWKKTVVRRGIKTIPSVPAFDKIVSREDRDFSFDRRATTPAEEVPAAPPARDGGELIAEEAAPPAQATAPAAKAEPAGGSPPPAASGVLGQFQAALGAAETLSGLSSVWAMFEPRLKGEDRNRATTMFETKFEALSEGK